MSFEINNNNNFKQEDINFRCPKCFLIPIINSDITKNSIEITCFNEHKKIILFEEIENYFKQVNILNTICVYDKCEIKANKYCINCFKLLCDEHSVLEKNNFFHKIINIKNIDKICFEHLDTNIAFCKFDKKTICISCGNCYDNHEIEYLKKINFEELNTYKEILYKIKSIENNDKYNTFYYIEELQKLLETFLEKLKEFKIKYNNRSKINLFLNNLLNSYNFNISQRVFNYNNIKNLEINFSQNFDKYIKNNSDNIYKLEYINLLSDFIKNINNFKASYELKNKINIKFSDNLKEETTLNEEFEDKKFNNFKLTDLKPKQYLQSNGEEIFCLTILSDGRLASGDSESYLNIYNKNTFNKEIEINNYCSNLFHIEQLKNCSNVATCFGNNVIKIIKIINQYEYQIIQTISGAHNSIIWKIIELSNSNLISCSFDKCLKFWEKKNNIYKETYIIKENENISKIMQIKKDCIVYNSGKNCLKFFNFEDKKNIEKDINNIELSGNIGTQFILIKENILIVGGNKKIYFIDCEKYNLIKEIDFNEEIGSIVKINFNIYLIGDNIGNITQYNIDENNEIKQISIKKEVHYGNIYNIIIFNENIISSSNNNSIIIWE